MINIDTFMFSTPRFGEREASTVEVKEYVTEEDDGASKREWATISLELKSERFTFYFDSLEEVRAFAKRIDFAAMQRQKSRAEYHYIPDCDCSRCNAERAQRQG